VTSLFAEQTKGVIFFRDLDCLLEWVRSEV